MLDRPSHLGTRRPTASAACTADRSRSSGSVAGQGIPRGPGTETLKAAAPHIRADERRQFEDLLGAVWLYIGRRYVTKQLTTEQKNLFADAVDAYWRRSDASEVEEFTPVDR
ncbi:hypothetical protein AB0J35_05005 [Nonomuraea angiospora]|uniref:hypothetical protein n=1 Tax=Nonomuraea angiospora TaxID=46172 RepID=UPI0034287A42